MLTGLLLALAIAVPLGCADDGPGDSPDEEVGFDTGEDGEDPPPKVCKTSCQECADLMKDAYACMAYDKSFDDSPDPLTTFDCIVCDNDAPEFVALTCGTQASIQGVYFTDMEVQLLPCADDSEGTEGTDDSEDSDDSLEAVKCADWLPNREVHRKSADEWDIERDFVTALVADPSRLAGCDGARMRRAFGFYRVASLDSDDLLGELGLMNDDVVQSINGYTMSSPFNAALAFFELWPDTRVFTVTVLRPGVGALTFTYNLV